jgi:myo-inositol 2-dehydrogenase / D-chiro-inositol 1-dehydrogenase
VVGLPVVEVYADGQANNDLFARHHDVDAACAVLRFRGGVLGVATASRNDPRGYDVRMEVFGLRDSIAVGSDARTPLRSTEPGVEASEKPGYTDFLDRFQAAYRAELHAFLTSVKEGAASPCTVDDARSALVVALAADRSQREHRPVRVEELT